MKQSYRTLPLLLTAAAVQHASADAVAVNDSITITQNSGSVIINVLANDHSTYPNADLFVTSTSARSAAYGSVNRNADQTITYTPEANYVGTDTFTYEVQDSSGYGGPAIATVTVHVTAAPTTPEISNNNHLEPHVTGARNKAVASMLDDACFFDNENTSWAVKADCTSLYAKIGDETTDLDAIVAEIAPDEALTQRRLLADNSRNTTSLLYRSMALLRAEKTGAHISLNNIALPSGGGAGDSFSSPWTLLSALQVENVERDYTLNEAGYDSKALSLLLGLGYRLNNNLNLGAALDWTNYDVDYVKNGGTLDSDLYSLTGFVSWYNGPFSVELQAGYTSGQSDTERRFRFPFTSYANSTYDSNQLTVSTQAEWAWQPGAWAVRPFLRIDYFDSKIDAFTETGDSVWLMQTAKQEEQQINTSIGINTSYTTSFSWGVMTPSLKVSMVNQNNPSNDPAAFQLVNANSAAGKFQLETDKLDKEFYQWELNTVFVLANGLSTFFSAETVSDYKNVSRHQISAGVNKEF